ncbi:heterogeneous nuclear ribonucleoprotein F-like [Sitodiplosis mosellana]|uniref:heterogeneous nuclear ribonucleoprotein F-like n=1 Tax=Sitodiplosis mosellana TaxID=263140 RepID=UPI0024443BDB|nr:heterogeneous nuclear ribonucleoprotein F-like [Sitodiplosis mosellana]
MSIRHEGGGPIESFDNDDIQGDCNGNIIRIRGLPWNTTKQEICDFFDGVNIVNGENGIHWVTLATNHTKPLSEAYIELASFDDLQRAQTFHKKNLGTRYIEVFESSFDEFQSIMSKQKGAQDESVVRLRGLPWNATESEISEFFDGLLIKQNNGIYIPYNKNGKASGEAFVHFETIEDCNQALTRNMNKLGHRYIEIFRSTEQQMIRSVMQTNPNRNNGGGRNSNSGNFQSNGNNRMHPYDRNGGNNFGRGNNMRGRNQNNRNDFRRDRPNNNNGDSFMQNSGQPNNRNFGNRSFNSNNGGGNGGNGGNSFSNDRDRFDQNNQNANGNFYEDFDLNEFAKNLIGFGNDSRQDFGGNRNFNNRQQDSGGNNDFFGNSNWKGSNNQFNSRGGDGGGGSGGGSSVGGGGGGTNNRFNNNRNFVSNDDTLSGQHCIHMRGLPYYTDEMDVFTFFSPLKPNFCKIIINKAGLHSGEAKAYFDSYDQVRTAMSKDRMKMGSRYIELFYGGSSN